MILATELSRLSRSLRDFCEVWDLFKKHQTGFITLREQFDTTTAAGEMMVFNLMNFAQYERKQTAERISANWQARAKRGLWNGGQVPLGFDRNPKNPGELLPNPVEAKQVEEIFKTFLEVGSVRETCREMSRRGVFSKRSTNKHGIEKGGGHFTVPSLYHVLTNRAYIGLREFSVPDGEVGVVQASWSPLIEESLFEAVQKRLANNRNKHKPDSWKKYPYPLTETLVCGECGKKLGGKSAHGKTRKHRYYAHPRQLHSDGMNHIKRCRVETLRAERIENLLLKSLKYFLQTPGEIEKWLEIYLATNNSEVPALEGKIHMINQEIAQKQRRVKNLVVRISELPPEVSADSFYEQMKEWNQKVQDLESARQELLSQASRLKSGMIDKNGLMLRLKRILARLEETPIEKRRPLYNNVIQFAEIHPTKIRVGVYAPTLPSDQQKATGTEGISTLGKSPKGKDCEPRNLSLVNRGGSTTVKIGAPGRT